ncbi:pyruvate dehydrogenase [Streptomyces alboflavus]|uniref:Pyruvate dehydrogenase n=1 Tax=Streptomyces alboflavus TaxID=67267 RepID=A0A1Z1WQV9_9ACTN|nr:pyruvate dehydrogenase [Streptomyces alboflavus]
MSDSMPKPSADTGGSRPDAVALYRTMRLIRRFEERCIALVKAGEIVGGIHPYIGQEAVAAGVCAALRPDDVITSTHRGHGHVLAKGADLNRMTAELMGRTTGLNKGRGGSMHAADVGLGILARTASSARAPRSRRVPRGRRRARAPTGSPSASSATERSAKGSSWSP